MAIVQRSVQINASPQETMAVLSDASRWPDWYPGMTEINIAAPFPEEGGKVVFKVKSGGISMPITETVLAYDPDKLQLLEMEGMLSGRARWEFTLEGDRTRMTTTFDYALPGGVFGKLADALIVRRMNGKSLWDERPAPDDCDDDSATFRRPARRDMASRSNHTSAEIVTSSSPFSVLRLLPAAGSER